MVFKDKKKYLIPGALLLGAAVTVSIVLIAKRSGKATKTTGKHTEELKDDLCVTLLAEYVKAGESGMAKEELKALYAKGFAQCPTVFLPSQQQDELPKLEDVRVQLAKKQEEQKAERGVNTSGVTSSKGNGNAADPSKPATVPLPKNNSNNDIKIDNGQTSDTTKGEIKSVDDKTPNAKQLSGNADSTGNHPTAPITPGNTGTLATADPITPQQLKDKRTEAMNECMEMLKGIESKNTASEMLASFSDEQRMRIETLEKEGLIPKYCTPNKLIMDLFYGKMLKHMNTGNNKEAQEAYNKYADVTRASGIGTNDVDITQTANYKLWRAVESDNWAEAAMLLDRPIFLPPDIREAMKKNPEKLKLLKELNDAQMDALWDYCKWNKELLKYSVDFIFTGDEWKMAEAKAAYNKTAEMMRLLNGGIHKDFDFAIPALQERKSHMELLDEKLKNRTPAFEAAFKKLRSDRNLGMSLVISAMYELKEQKDQVELLETVKILKGKFSADYSLAEILISSAKKEPLEDGIKAYLDRADFTNDQQLSAIGEALEKMRISGGSPLELASLDFWKQVVSLVKSLKPRFEEKVGLGGNLRSSLSEMVGLITPFSLEVLGKELSGSNIGAAEGADLVKQCAHCIEERSKSDPSDVNKAESAYAKAYLAFYLAVKGVGMHLLDAVMTPYEEALKAAGPQVVTALVQSKERLCALKGTDPANSLKDKITALVNAKAAK